MHVKIANIGHEFRLIQIESDIRSVHWKNEIIDPDAPFLAADVAPLLMLGRKRAIEIC